MGKLFPGCGIWFRESQRGGGSKNVPAVVLWVGEEAAVIIVARGTSQAYDHGFSGEGALVFGPEDVSGKRLRLTLLTRFRSDDVKRISAEQVVERCAMLPRDDWKKLHELTKAQVAILATSAQIPVESSNGTLGPHSEIVDAD